MTKEIKKDRLGQLIKVQAEAAELFEKKNADYGDAFANYGSVGVIVRIGDKIARLTSVTNKGINLVEDEKIRDTLIDLHNYSAMAIMLLDEKEEKNRPPELNIPVLSDEEIEKNRPPVLGISRKNQNINKN